LTVLRRWESDFGFAREEHMLKELKGEFYDLLRAKKPIDDIVIGYSQHGRDTHRLQWNCIMREAEKSPASFFTAEELHDRSAKELVAEVYAQMANFKSYWFRDQEKNWKHRKSTNDGPWLDFHGEPERQK
jgi:hypothetical protein